MKNDFQKNNNLKNFESKLMKILNHVSQNWSLGSQYIDDENDWYSFDFSCPNDLGSMSGVMVSYRPNAAMVLEVSEEELDNAHYAENVKTILEELKKLDVKNAEWSKWKVR